MSSLTSRLSGLVQTCTMSHLEVDSKIDILTTIDIDGKVRVWAFDNPEHPLKKEVGHSILML